MPQRYYRADTIYGRGEDLDCIIETVEFDGVARTKLDALKKEVSGLYASKNVDELVKNSHLAARHMKVNLVSDLSINF